MRKGCGSDKPCLEVSINKDSLEIFKTALPFFEFVFMAYIYIDVCIYHSCMCIYIYMYMCAAYFLHYYSTTS